jgi:hypothetical protein
MEEIIMTKNCLTAVLTGLLLGSALNSMTAQNYSLGWYKIAGGGGTSANSQYSLTGTIGQHDAGAPATSGATSLTSGFWSLVAVVQTPGAPSLIIQRLSRTSAKVSWPSPSTGFLLQQTGDLDKPIWSNYSGTVSDDGTIKSVMISPLTGNLYFRLKK